MVTRLCRTKLHFGVRDVRVHRVLLSVIASFAGILALSSCAPGQSGRNFIVIVGSSTMYPFSTIVAERFGRRTSFKTPKVEATGSGGGFKLFCAGIGVRHPDITNSSRRIKPSELKMCASNGVGGVVEVKVGYDGIAVAYAATNETLELTLKDLWLALAKQVPAPDGQEALVNNPHVLWSDVNAALPAVRIEVLGPPPTSGTRDAFVELAMEGGCRSFNWIAAMAYADRDAFRDVCHTLREDGVFTEVGENDNLIVQKLNANPDGLGILGFSFLDQNAEQVLGASIDGVAPTFENIGNGRYPISRPLYFYVKQAHVDVIPGLREFLGEFTSDRSWGDEGYLASRGLVPMPENERAQVLGDVLALTPVSL
ncbi:MAG: substrate-binding domain-containing protein [Pseudomonadota bacterium]